MIRLETLEIRDNNHMAVFLSDLRFLVTYLHTYFCIVFFFSCCFVTGQTDVRTAAERYFTLPWTSMPPDDMLALPFCLTFKIQVIIKWIHAFLGVAFIYYTAYQKVIGIITKFKLNSTFKSSSLTFLKILICDILEKKTSRTE